MVVATGVMQKPVVPTFAPELDPRITQLHSSDYRNPSQLQEGPVLVVGASHSGADIAYEASCRARDDPVGTPTRARSRRRSRPGAGARAFACSSSSGKHVLTMDTPLGRKMRPHIRHDGAPLLRYRKKDLLAAGVERVIRADRRRAGRPAGARRRPRPRRPERGLVHRLPSGLLVDQDPVRGGEDGYPVQYRGAVDSAPGLYFVGLLFLHSFASMLIAGSGQRCRAGGEAHRVADGEQPSECSGGDAGRRAGRIMRAKRRGAGMSEERADAGSLLVWNGRVTRVQRVAAAGRRRHPRRERSPPHDAKGGVRVP